MRKASLRSLNNACKPKRRFCNARKLRVSTPPTPSPPLHLSSSSSRLDSRLQQFDKQFKQKSFSGFHVHSGLRLRGLGVFGRLCWCTLGAHACSSEKTPTITQTFRCGREAFFALVNFGSAALLINRIMCLRSHVASSCVCLGSCTITDQVLFLSSTSCSLWLNLSYLLKPCVPY